MGLNPMDQVSLRPDRSVDSIAPFTCVSPQPFLASEKRAKRDGDLQALIALEPNSLAIRRPEGAQSNHHRRFLGMYR